MDLITFIIENFGEAFGHLDFSELPTFLQELVSQADAIINGGSTTGFENLPEQSTTGFNNGGTSG